MQQSTGSIVSSFHTLLTKLKGLPIRVNYLNTYSERRTCQIDFYIGTEKEITYQEMHYTSPEWELYIGEGEIISGQINTELKVIITNISLAYQDDKSFLLVMHLDKDRTVHIGVPEYNVLSLISRTFSNVIRVQEHVIYHAIKTRDIKFYASSSRSLTNEDVHTIEKQIRGLLILKVARSYGRALFIYTADLQLALYDFWLLIDINKPGQIVASSEDDRELHELQRKSITDITVENYVIKVCFNNGKIILMKQSGRPDMHIFRRQKVMSP